jgi:hypothetical protein
LKDFYDFSYGQHAPYNAKLHRTTTHTPSKAEKDNEINKIMQQNHGYKHLSQPHLPPEGGGVAAMQGTR